MQALQTNWRSAQLNDADRAMLVYADKLTLTPWDMVEADLTPLREQGFSDAAILDINQVTCYFAYVNRLADGLGVEIEPHYDTADFDKLMGQQ